MAEKPGSLGAKIGDGLFRGVMLLLYGKRAGETRQEKLTRVGLFLVFLVALIAILTIAKKAISGF